MSDGSEKPFEATPHRILKAKREGNVARASELGANLSFAAGSLALAGLAPVVGAIASRAVVASMRGELPPSALILAVALVPIGAAALAGVLGFLLQSGGISVTAIEPKLERLNPAAGLRRILSRETVAHSARAAAAFALASVAMAPFIAWTASALLHAASLRSAAALTWNGARDASAAACTIGLIFAVAEYAAARRQWLRKLRMSFDERKREAKEEEGDAVARGRRRALHRALLRSGMQRLRDAAFVVTNPQHVAVALEYRPPEIGVPRVLVRAADAAALRVRALAAAYAIPIVENVWLARTLYRDAREGESIPHVHYVAVAEVVIALLQERQIAR